MLRVRSLLEQHIQAILVSLKGLCQTPWATVTTVFVIAATLVLPALFGVMADNLRPLTRHWQHSGHISLYLKTPLSPVDEAALLARVQKMLGVGEATLKSPEQGLLELEQQEGMQDIRSYLPENPLPGVIEVVPTLSVNTPDKLRQLFMALKTDPMVEQAKFDLQWVERLHAIFRLLTTFAKGLIVLLTFSVVLIVGNTLRLMFHSRYDEIRLLKLIGAKESFILRPFLYTGTLYGLAGAVVAVIVLNIVLLSVTFAVSQLAAVYDIQYSLTGLSLQQIVMLVICSTILGWLGAFGSVKSQLSAIEP